MKKKLGLILLVIIIGVILGVKLDDALGISSTGLRMDIHDCFMMLWGGVLSLVILWSIGILRFFRE